MRGTRSSREETCEAQRLGSPVPGPRTTDQRSQSDLSVERVEPTRDRPRAKEEPVPEHLPDGDRHLPRRREQAVASLHQIRDEDVRRRIWAPRGRRLRGPRLSRRLATPAHIDPRLLRRPPSRAAERPVARNRISERRHPDELLPRPERNDPGRPVDREVPRDERTSCTRPEPRVPPEIRQGVLPQLAPTDGTELRPLAPPISVDRSDVPKIRIAGSDLARRAADRYPWGILRPEHRVPERDELACGLAVDRDRTGGNRPCLFDTLLAEGFGATVRTRVSEGAMAESD